MLLDGQVLIDCGATVPDAMRHLGVAVHGIGDILLTHTHSDHIDIKATESLVA